MPRQFGETLFQIGGALQKDRRERELLERQLRQEDAAAQQQVFSNQLAQSGLDLKQSSANREVEAERQLQSRLDPFVSGDQQAPEGFIFDPVKQEFRAKPKSAVNVFTGGVQFDKPGSQATAVEFDDETGEIFDAQGNVIGRIGRNG